MNASQFPLAVNLVLFVVGAAVIWFAGKAATRQAQQLAARLNLGEAFVGMLLLGLLTSLPEIATTSSAAAFGNAALAGSNLLGGVAMQMALLAVIDGIALKGRSLTFAAKGNGLLPQAALLAILSALAALCIAARALPTVAQAGPTLLALVYVGGIYGLYRGERRRRKNGSNETHVETDVCDVSTPRLGLLLASSAFGVFAGGFVVAETGAAIAEQAGLSETVVGASLVALSTSLPEITTTYTAVRLGAYGMAVGNILGTNALELALFLPADLIYTEGAILAALGNAEIAIATVNIVLALAVLFGLTRRRDRNLLGFGIDSGLVIAAYGAGILLVYLLSG